MFALRISNKMSEMPKYVQCFYISKAHTLIVGAHETWRSRGVEAQVPNLEEHFSSFRLLIA